jgi:UV DNA damage endonuclease
MKIGYPCINSSLECRSSRTFRLKNYSESRLIKTIGNNLECLEKILEYNKSHNLLFFRITSDLIPFGSHPVLKYNWQEHFKKRFKRIGQFIKDSDMRITMHPGQYTVFNSNRQKVFKKAVKDLAYHIEVLDLMDLGATAKVQIHVGGVYGDKKGSINRFIERYENLNQSIKKRLIIENDEKSYSLVDCMKIHRKTSIPVVFDTFHHESNNNGEPIDKAFQSFTKTWDTHDGIPIIHYSSQNAHKGKFAHAKTIDLEHFKKILHKTKEFDYDIMLEIKNKEQSALQALEALKGDGRFNTYKN